MFRYLLAGVTAIGLLLGAAGAAQAQCPEVGKAPQKFTITEGFPVDPRRHDVIAGGDLNLGACPSVPGGGWITKLPDFVVNYKTKSGSGPSGYTLTFRIESKADTVLLINDPNGNWHYNDDGGNRLNAKVTFRRALPGRYDVWVGTYGKKLERATLVVTELE